MKNSNKKNSIKYLLYLIKSDLYRYNGRFSTWEVLKGLLTNKGFKFTFWFRVAHHFQNRKLLNIMPRIMFFYHKRVLVTDINYRASVGPGFEMHHVFGTTFGEDVEIGKNVVLSHNTTIGTTKKLGMKNKAPRIKDNVYIGPGALIIGDITIGNNVIIGGNAVVTKDIPDNAVVVGNPGKIISYIGSENYVRNTNYEDFISY